MKIEKVSAANKGEWSELYVLFKIFQDKTIPAADSELKPVEGGSYRFLEVYRKDSDTEITYNLRNMSSVEVIKNGTRIKTLDSTLLKNKTKRIFESIKSASNSSFEVEDIDVLMKEYLIEKIKANSQEKTDLLALTDDRSNVTDDRMGFSIKSHVGGAPTLINSSSQTNFLFEVSGFKGDVNVVNRIEDRTKVRDRLKTIYDMGGRLNFVKISSPTFTANLRFTDTMFPKILASMLLSFYSGKGNSFEDLSSIASDDDNIEITKEEVLYKVQGFLRSSALGMVPSKIWDTRLNAYGGYIVVLDDGALLCYSLLKDDDFKNYLLNNTRFDTPSTTRHRYGFLFKENGKVFINLNLQIRFKK